MASASAVTASDRHPSQAGSGLSDSADPPALPLGNLTQLDDPKRMFVQSAWHGSLFVQRGMDDCKSLLRRRPECEDILLRRNVSLEVSNYSDKLADA